MTYRSLCQFLLNIFIYDISLLLVFQPEFNFIFIYDISLEMIVQSTFCLIYIYAISLALLFQTTVCFLHFFLLGNISSWNRHLDKC